MEPFHVIVHLNLRPQGASNVLCVLEIKFYALYPESKVDARISDYKNISSSTLSALNKLLAAKASEGAANCEYVALTLVDAVRQNMNATAEDANCPICLSRLEEDPTTTLVDSLIPDDCTGTSSSVRGPATTGNGTAGSGATRSGKAGTTTSTGSLFMTGSITFNPPECQHIQHSKCFSLWLWKSFDPLVVVTTERERPTAEILHVPVLEEMVLRNSTCSFDTSDAAI